MRILLVYRAPVECGATGSAAVVRAIAAVAVAAFFAFLLGLSKYHREDAAFGARDWAVLAGFVAAGCALTFAGLAGGVPAFLAGPLVAAAGCFCWLLYKDKGLHPAIGKGEE